MNGKKVVAVAEDYCLTNILPHACIVIQKSEGHDNSTFDSFLIGIKKRIFEKICFHIKALD